MKHVFMIFAVCAATAVFANSQDQDETSEKVVKPSSLVLSQDGEEIVKVPDEENFR